MELQVITKIGADLETSKDAIDRLIEENLKTKLDRYLKKFEKESAEWLMEIKLDKNKKWLFAWILQVNLDWNDYRYEREDYKNLDDLINHLFLHLKEELSNK